MKNPFVMMALMAAAMAEAWKENKYRDLGLALPTGRGRTRTPGKRNPAGSKFYMRAYKAKHGHKAESIEEAREWYAGYLKEMDAEVRRREAARKSDRRSPMKLAA